MVLAANLPSATSSMAMVTGFSSRCSPLTSASEAIWRARRATTLTII